MAGIVGNPMARWIVSRCHGAVSSLTRPRFFSGLAGLLALFTRLYWFYLFSGDGFLFLFCGTTGFPFVTTGVFLAATGFF